MKHTWIQNKISNQLIVFFNGWGCDEHQFMHLSSTQFDVLMLSDYRDLSLDDVLIEKIKEYEGVSIAAWSYGVWIAQYVWEKYQLPKQFAIAINGTTKPVHNQFGIAETIVLGTLENLSVRNLMKFQRRMVGGNEAWKKFEADKPQREFEEQKEELAALIQHFRQEVSADDFYEKAMIGSNDLIFTATNQHLFWKDKAEIFEVEAPHFCFYNFTCWDDLLM